MEHRSGGAGGGWTDGRDADRDWSPGRPYHPRPVGPEDPQAAAAAAFADGRRLRDAAEARRRRPAFHVPSIRATFLGFTVIWGRALH